MVNGGDVELAQAAVLGAALIDESLVGELTLKVEDRDFATPKCRMVYQALKKLFLAGQPTDPRHGSQPAERRRRGWLASVCHVGHGRGLNSGQRMGACQDHAGAGPAVSPPGAGRPSAGGREP